MAGKRTQSTVAPKLNGIQIQSSVYGAAIPRGWGTFKVSANLLWYDNFQSIAHTSTQQVGGKGGGNQSQSSTTYTYTAAIIMGLCQGPIDQIRSVYKDKSVFTDTGGAAPGEAGLSIANGALGQAAWGFLTSNYPTQAIGYSGIAYAYASNYDLGDNASLSNHAFEVQNSFRVSGHDDANPKDIIADLLPSVPFWPAGIIGDLTTYGTYCLATGLLLSPVLDGQRTASDFLTELLVASNSNCFWSEGVLKIAPYGDTTVTGNSTTYTPNLTPIYDLTVDDFLAEEGEEPVQEMITRSADAYNYLQVEFLDRAHQYNTQVVPGVDQGSIDQFGRRAAQSPYSMHSICDATVAGKIAQIMVQRTSSVRGTYKFKLGPHYCLLDPMDLVTITVGDISQKLVRITDIQEDGDTGEFMMTAEEMLIGMAHAATFSRQASSGYNPNQHNVPGSIQEYVLYCPPAELSASGREVWVGAAGGAVDWGGCEVWASWDNANYQRKAVITSPTRFGLLTTIIPNVADPDTTTTFDLNTGTTGSLIENATTADHDNATTLFLVDSELMAYKNAALVTAHNYAIDHLRRGLYSTTPALHSVGADWIRLDDAIIAVPFQPEQDGKTLCVKFVSFNTFGRALEDISTVTAHTIVLTPNTSSVGIATGIVGPGGITLTYQDVYNALLKFPAKNLFREIDYVASTGATLVDPMAVTGGQALWGFTMAGGSAAKFYNDHGGYGTAAQGGVYSISFQAKIASGTGQMRVGFRVGGAAGSGGAAPSDLPDKIFALTTTLTRFEWNGLVSADAGFPTAELLYFTSSGDAASTVTVTDLSIEFSTAASSGWRPSPDDHTLLRYAGFIGELTADTTATHVSSGFTGQGSLATRNAIVTRSASAPSSPFTGDIWVVLDTNGRVVNIATWSGSAWIQSGTNNVFTQSTTAPSTPTVNDIWIVLSGTTPVAIKIWNGTSWLLDADLTSVNTAAAISGQGALATVGSANWSTQVTGSGKPADNADVTSTHTAAGFTGQGGLATLSNLSTLLTSGTGISVSTAGTSTTITNTGSSGTVLTVGGISDVSWSGFISSTTTESTDSTGTPTCSGGTGTGRKTYWTIVSGDAANISTPSGSGLFAVSVSMVVHIGDAKGGTLRCTVIDDAGNLGFADVNYSFTETH